MNFYNVLKYSTRRNINSINTSCNNLSQRFHPDKNPNDKLEKK